MPTKRQVAVGLAEAIEVVVVTDTVERLAVARVPWRNVHLPKALVQYLNWTRAAVIAGGTAASLTERLRRPRHP